MTDTGRELFEHELRDIFDAENKLTNALETMSKKTGDEQLSNAFAEHKSVTQKQVQRLERVFEIIDRSPRRETCYGINGLIEEFTKFVKDEEPSQEVLDAFATGAAMKVEAYEIVSYKSLIKLAQQLGLSDAIPLFEESLREEQETAQELEQMAELVGKKLG